MTDLLKRKPNRLGNYDYSKNGAYFVTVCTKERRETLCEIRRGGALLLPIGRIVEEEIQNLQKYGEIAIDKYVIMPNHVHMIILVQKCLEREEQSPSPTSIPALLCAFKSITTKRANALENPPDRRIWQRSYHDHIIRGEQDYQKIWEYMDTNPLKWELDCFYTGNPPQSN